MRYRDATRPKTKQVKMRKGKQTPTAALVYFLSSIFGALLRLITTFKPLSFSLAPACHRIAQSLCVRACVRVLRASCILRHNYLQLSVYLQSLPSRHSITRCCPMQAPMKWQPNIVSGHATDGQDAVPLSHSLNHPATRREDLGTPDNRGATK